MENCGRFVKDKTGVFAHFGIGYGLRGNYNSVESVRPFNSKRLRKNSVICEFEMAFKKYSFCRRSNHINGDIISVNVNIYVAFCDHLQV